MIRRPIRNINDPVLQEALVIQRQRNSNAAIPGMLGRNLYGQFATREGGREIAANAFGRRMDLAKRQMAESAKQHNMSYGLKYKQLRDAKKGAKLASYIGLGQLGLNAWGKISPEARKAKADNAAFMDHIRMILAKNNPYSRYGQSGKGR